MTDAETATETPEEVQEEFALVEIFGHRRHWGRILEVQQYGTAMLRVDIPTEGDFEKGYTSHFYGGSSIFCITPTDRATVEARNRPFEPARPSLLAAPPGEVVVLEDEGEEELIL